MWLELAFAGALIYAIGNILDKFLVHKVSVKALLFASLVSSILALFALPGFTQITFSLPALISGALYFAAIILYFEGLKKTEVSAALILLYTLPIFTLVFSAVFIGETLYPIQYLGAFMAVAGVMLLNFNGRSIELNKSTVLLLSSAAVFALQDVLTKAALSNSQPLNVMFWTRVALSMILIPAWLAWRSEIKFNTRENFSLSLASGILSQLAAVLLIFSYSLAPVSQVNIATTIQPVFVLLLATAIAVVKPGLIEEDLTKGRVIQKTVSLVLVLTGIWLAAA